MKRRTFVLSYMVTLVLQAVLIYVVFNGGALILLGQPMGMLYGVIIVIAWKRLECLECSKIMVVIYALAVLPIHVLSFANTKMMFLAFILSAMLFLYIIRFLDEDA